MALIPPGLCADDASRRRFIRDFLTLTGWVFVGEVELIRSGSVAIAGDPKNDNKAWGTLKGRLLYDGEVPDRKEVDLEKAGIRGEDLKWFTSTGPILNEDWVVDKQSKAVQWVLVWLIPEDPKGAALRVHDSLQSIDARQKAVVVDQLPRGYSSHVVGLREGQDLVMKNSSPIAHVFNLPEFGRNLGFNRNMPSKTELTVSDLKAERFFTPITCPPHPWERMWLRVFDHPYFAVTVEDGTFEIPLAPAGTCRLVVWQESMGYKGGRSGRFGSPVTIEGAAVNDLGDITIKPKT